MPSFVRGTTGVTPNRCEGIQLEHGEAGMGTASVDRLSGVMAATITPFKEDESLDEERIGSHVELLLEGGIRGIVPIGGSGEYVNLSAEERRRVVRRTIEVVNGRVPVIVGTLAPSTREALDIGMFAARAGANALLVLPPYYIRPSLAGIVDHFARVAGETNLPVIVYNNPPRTNWAMDADALTEIAAVPGVIGVKDCDRDLASISVKIGRVGDQLAILGGDDDLVFSVLLAGGDGAIMATANLAPRLCVELYEACLRGDLATARYLQGRLLPLVHVRHGPNHPGPLRDLMAMVGRPIGPARRPLLGMTNAQRSKAEEVLERCGPVA